MSELKRALHCFTGFSKDQDTGLPFSIAESIKYLLDDNLQMKAKNRYTLSERNNMRVQILMCDISKLAFSEYVDDVVKAKELIELIGNSRLWQE